MKYNRTMTVSAVALAVASSFSVSSTEISFEEVANAIGSQNKNNPIKQSSDNVANQSTSISEFAQWRDKTTKARKENVTDQFIVTFEREEYSEQLLGLTSKSSASSDNKILKSLSRSMGEDVTVVKSMGQGKLVLSIGKAVNQNTASAMANTLIKNPMVNNAEPDPRRYPMAENQPWGISAVQADQVSDNESGNMTVCVIDSGYDINNPDLSGNLVSGTNDSGTGSWSTPGGSHGSHVAGTIAAINNAEGVVGVLPNQNVNLHIIKVFNASGWAYSSDLVGAIDKCSDAGANVVNMSLGGAGSSNAERNSLQSFYDNGILLVAAAGNDGDSSLSYPASYDSVISVAAVDENGQHAEFSQYTSQVELSGPGEAILSTVGINDGRQGYISYGSISLGDDDVLPPTRFVQNGSNFDVTNVNGSASGELSNCSRTGATYSCGSMSGKICVAERHSNQAGSSYPEIDPAKACADAGASGVIVFSNSERPGLQNPFLVDANADVSVPVVSVNRTTGQQLIAAAGQNATLQVAGNTDYAYYNGTSMATPHVAGVAALAWSKNPTCTAAQVRQALTTTALDLDSAGRDNRTGYGMVQTKAASDYMATLCSTGGGTGGTGSDVLENGVAKTSLSAAKDAQLSFTIEVPAGATDLSFVMSGGSGDADLYVSFGAAPTTSNYECRSWNSGNAENCDFSSPSAGTYHVLVNAYSAFSGASLTASFTETSTGGGSGGTTGSTAQVTDISATRNNWQYYTWDVPAGMSTLSFVTSGGSGDGDLYIRLGSQPTTSQYNCRSWESGNNETCTITNPQAGTWHIGIQAYRTFSGMTLDAAYNP